MVGYVDFSEGQKLLLLGTDLSAFSLRKSKLSPFFAELFRPLEHLPAFSFSASDASGDQASKHHCLVPKTFRQNQECLNLLKQLPSPFDAKHSPRNPIHSFQTPAYLPLLEQTTCRTISRKPRCSESYLPTALHGLCTRMLTPTPCSTPMHTPSARPTKILLAWKGASHHLYIFVRSN